MTEKQIKKQLRKMLGGFTPGTVLHLFGEIFHELAEDARHDNDVVAYERARNVERALFVFGLGLDGAFPR